VIILAGHLSLDTVIKRGGGEGGGGKKKTASPRHARPSTHRRGRRGWLSGKGGRGRNEAAPPRLLPFAHAKKRRPPGVDRTNYPPLVQKGKENGGGPRPRYQKAEMSGAQLLPLVSRRGRKSEYCLVMVTAVNTNHARVP